MINLAPLIPKDSKWEENAHKYEAYDHHNSVKAPDKLDPQLTPILVFSDCQKG